MPDGSRLETSRRIFMKLEELATIVSTYLSRDKPYSPTKSVEVVIETACRGVPHRPMVTIASAQLGFDWTEGLFILVPSKPIVNVNALSIPVSRLAKQHLESQKTYHSKLGFNFIPKARESAWLDGFKAGVRCHVTSVGECSAMCGNVR